MEKISETHKLKTGNLELLYTRGEIRQIRLGSTTILSSIYGAVRDRNWATVPFQVSNESLRSTKDGFQLSLDVDYGEDQVLFQAQFRIEGAGNKLFFIYEGQASSTFLKNRIGLCILHPIKECKDKALEAIHPDGSSTRGKFPLYISPVQPFTDLSGIRWSPDTHMDAELIFEGEIFEMEDQRNWSDASYKTYCTPLENPFPVQMDAGSKVKQGVTLLVHPTSPGPAASLNIESSKKTLSLPVGAGASLPSIGTSRCSEPNQITRREAGILKDIPFSHYRVDLRLNHSNWPDSYTRILEEQEMMGWPLELALHFGDNPEYESDAFIKTYASQPVRIKHLLIYDDNSLTVDPRLKQVISRLKEAIPGIPVGGGTDANFTELNRNHPDAVMLDFISYTICPQVHAFDNLTLIENLEAQSETVSSARALFQKPVAISALTLRQRFNAVATDYENEHQAEPESDPRQHSLFAAGWTLGSLRNLIQAGAASLTYYETMGARGILSRQDSSGGYSPLYYLFKEILSNYPTQVIPAESSHPLEFDGLFLHGKNESILLLCNYTSLVLKIGISDLPGPILNTYRLEDLGWIPVDSAGPNVKSIILKPAGIYKITYSQ